MCGYIGYSESRNSAAAKAEGRFPKTLFKREYGVSGKMFAELVKGGYIEVTEWHHTSKKYNRTDFYGWTESGQIWRYKTGRITRTECLDILRPHRQSKYARPVARHETNAYAKLYDSQIADRMRKLGRRIFGHADAKKFANAKSLAEYAELAGSLNCLGWNLFCRQFTKKD